MTWQVIVQFNEDNPGDPYHFHAEIATTHKGLVLYFTAGHKYGGIQSKEQTIGKLAAYAEITAWLNDKLISQKQHKAALQKLNQIRD